MDDRNPRVRLIALGESARGRYMTGASVFVDAYLDGMSLREFADMRMGNLVGLMKERGSYNPAFWRHVIDEIRAEVDGVYYCSRPKERTAVREVWERAKDMAAWHLHPIWGRPDVASLRSLDGVHRIYFGDPPPIVVGDDWKRKVRRAASPVIFAANDHRCVRCGSSDRLSVDHIVPIMRGGLNYGLNFQTLCMPCNVWKLARVWWPGAPDGVSAFFPLREISISTSIREERA